MKTLMVLASTLTLGFGLVGCRPSPAARAETATKEIRQMDQEILDAQKQVVTKFKALPEADAIRLDMGSNFDGWAVSDKNLSKNEDDMEKALISYQKDARDEALIGELHLYTKKVSKNCQENIPDFEQRIINGKKAVAEGHFNYEGSKVPLTDKDKTNWINRTKVFALQEEFMKAEEAIADRYEVKLAKLLG